MKPRHWILGIVALTALSFIVFRPGTGSALPPGLTDVGQKVCNTNASGFCRITHELGTAPISVQVTGMSPIIGAAGVPGTLLADDFNAVNFRVRVFNPLGDIIPNSTVVLTYSAFAGPVPAPTSTAPPTPPAPTTAPSTP